eukprot:scaffold228_cov56-Cyclotella_meneghiniana.AAC.2
MEIFFLYLGLGIPWWNKAVDSPDFQMPKTMNYLSNNFTGNKYSFRHAQVMCGLTKGRDELIKMTSKCLFAVPIIYLLFSHHEHGASFLCALLVVLHKFEQELDDKEVDQQDYILIHQPSRKWGLYIHSNVNDRQPEEKKWFDILCPQKCDVVHCCWWRQFHLNDKVVAGDLQRLSREYAIRVVPDDESPLVGFKLHYPLLFECLEAIFALYASNSRLAEQIPTQKSSCWNRHGRSRCSAQLQYLHRIQLL